MLIGNFNALTAVYRLHFANLIVLHGADAEDAEQVVRVDGAFDQLVAGAHVVALGDLELAAVVDRILLGFALAVVGGDDQLAALLAVLRHAHDTADFRQRGFPLGLSGFEELFDAGKTLGNVLAGRNAAGVEGTHGKLRARLADGLRGDDADRFAHIDQTAVRHVRAVAARADAVLALAGQNRTDHDLFDAGRGDLLGLIMGDQLVLRHNQLAGRGIVHVLGGHAAADALLELLDALAVRRDVAHLLAADVLAAALEAVDLADDDLLRHVHQTAGHVTGVGGTQSGIGQRFTGAVG